MSKNDSSSLVIGGVILLAIGGGVYYYMTHKPKDTDGHPDLPATPTPSIMGALGTAVGQPAPAPFGVSVPSVLPGTPNPLPAVQPPREGFGVRYPVPTVGNPAITGSAAPVDNRTWTVAGRKPDQPTTGGGFGVRAPREGILMPPQFWPGNEHTLPYEPPMYESSTAEAVGV